MADFLGALAGAKEGRPDPRLEPYRGPQNAGMTEGTGGTGGFLVERQLVAQILGQAFVESGILSRVNVLPMASSMTAIAGFNTKDHSSGAIAGLTLNWEGEGDTFPEQTPSLVEESLIAKKGAILVPVTNELLYDGPAAEVQLRQIMQQAARFGLSNGSCDASCFTRSCPSGKS